MIKLANEISKTLTKGMEMGGGIELPFFAPVAWVVNGDAKLKALGGALFFGGWAINAEDMEQAMQQFGEAAVPSGWVKGEMISGQGKSFDAYTSRSILVAPIAVRESWFNQNGVRKPTFDIGLRHHVQVLSFVGFKNGTIHPFGPMVLSAKGFQAKNLLEAFKAWNNHTAQVRRAIAPEVPAWCFYSAIGTFGAERKVVMVGKSSQSPITPVSAYLPDKLEEAVMESLFVGETVAGMMAGYLDQAREWIKAWKSPVVENSIQEEDNIPEYSPEYSPEYTDPF